VNVSFIYLSSGYSGEGIAEWVALWGKHGIRSLSSGLDIPTSQAERVIHADFAIVYPEGRSRRTH